MQADALSHDVEVSSAGVVLRGILGVPANATGIVLFAHGSGSGRLSPRNNYVAHVLQEAGLGTLLIDLLTREEEIADARTGHLRFDIDFLARRLLDAARWLVESSATASLAVGYFGASTGAAAALQAAAAGEPPIFAVVSRGGRPDLAMASLSAVKVPTLLIVGGEDVPVIALNRDAYKALGGEKELNIVPGATHLFEEPGALESVARLASEWFVRHLPPA
ncbi:MAG TPA: dienelactone hydrolase family protein [Gemmatimonadaceae bacterium]|nr:dienelactone hydrolase family protein [Gemmatimonadaceae bacterium]